MSKAILTIGYKTFVMDISKAAQVTEALGNAEQYEKKWREEKDGGTTHHVSDAATDVASMQLISNDLYRMAKLAGKST